MIKKVTATALAAAVILAALLIVIPRLTRKRADTLTIGSGKTTGNLLPAIEGGAGDKAAWDLIYPTLKYTKADTSHEASYDVPSVGAEYTVYFADRNFNETKIKNT